VLIALSLAALAGWAMLLAAAVARVVDALDRRRLRRVVAQIRVTDAIHRALGPIVAPTVSRHRRQPWTVAMGLGPRDLAVAGRLVELAGQALGPEGGPVRVVLTRRTV
jgi:hypothetical protein